MKLYIEPRDWWIGVYISPEHVYLCPLPCCVIRFRRRRPEGGILLRRPKW